MPLESMSQMLRNAKDNNYAVAAFNILDYNSSRAIIEAAKEHNSPVIIQTSVKTVLFWDYKEIVSWIKSLAEAVKVPVALHLDHCIDIDIIEKCINHGWTSVMIDASEKPFEENCRMTSEVIKMARPKRVSVEAELGAIVGVEDDIHISEQDAHLADVEQSVKFTKELDMDCFAPAIGTAHGLYKGEPKIAFDRLQQIAYRTGKPLALHGGTGLAEDIIKRCIRMSCAKVNISTQLKHVFIDSFVNYHGSNPHEYNPLKGLQHQFDDIKKTAVYYMKLFGSADKG